MALQMFDMDKKKIIELIKFYQRAPKKFGVASGMLLNNFAFGTREKAIGTIHAGMTVRSEAFVKRSIVVNKANFRAPMMSQRSEVGSIARPRFSGWIEQETGKATDRTRAFLLEARKGQKKKKAMPSTRLKPSKIILKPEDMGGSSANITGFHHRAQVLLMWTWRNKWRKPFMIRGHKRLKAGLYKWKGKKLRKLQTFKPRRKQPRKFPWLTISRNKFLRGVNVAREWERVLKRVVK